MTPEPSLSAEWSLGEDAFADITRDMRALDPRTIVEFGSGASSVRLALAFPEARIHSFENSEDFAERVRHDARAHGLGDDRLTIEFRPLCFRRIGAAIYETYAPGPFPSRVDAVLIDGPPYWTGRGREACLYDVFASLRVGGRAYLDDHRRPEEQRIVENWQRSYPGALRVTPREVGHGICVVEKVAATQQTPHIAPATALDTWLVHLHTRAKRLFTGHPAHRTPGAPTASA
jgi:hypothetical protein